MKLQSQVLHKNDHLTHFCREVVEHRASFYHVPDFSEILHQLGATPVYSFRPCLHINKQECSHGNTVIVNTVQTKLKKKMLKPL